MRQVKRTARYGPAQKTLLFLTVSVLMLATAALALGTPSAADLKKNYDDAELQFQAFAYDSAAQILNNFLTSEEFAKESLDFKIQVHLLLVKCYYAMTKIEEAKVDAVENVFRQMLSLNPKISFESLLSDPQLLAIANRVKGATPPLQKRSFDFKKVKPAKAKVGKPKTVRIEIVPKTVGVRFEVDKKPPKVTVTDFDTTAIEITYLPDSSEVGTTQFVRVTAVGLDTTKSVSIPFEITKRRFPSWVKDAAWAGGALTGGYIVYRVIKWAIGGDGKNNGPTRLPDPPEPPR